MVRTNSTDAILARADEVVPPRGASRFMATSIPHAQLTTLTDSKHCGLFEYPQEFNNAVYQFLHANKSQTTTSTLGMGTKGTDK